MIQINLMPAVKQELVKSKRIKRLVFLGSLATIGACVFVIFSLYSYVYIAQKSHISRMTKEISTSKKKLQSVPDVDKILTVQSQLGSLPALHDEKPVLSRVFGYVSQLLPVNVGASQISLDTTATKATITGTATSLEQVNVFADTLKFARFKTSDNDTPRLAFSKVSLESVSKREKGASYTLSFSYDPTLFSYAALGGSIDGSKVQLLIESTTTTRLGDPAKIFKSQSTGEVVR
jgi:Tfp pilus assembly protein PilN